MNDELRATHYLDRGYIVRQRDNATLARISDCTVQFANELLFRYDAHDELVRALRLAVNSAQPIIAPLGPPLQEHVDTFAPWVAVARAALAKVSQ